MLGDFQVKGKNPAALFTLKMHRGDGMSLIAMDWKKGPPPSDFVGFAIEYKEPAGDKFYPLKNRINFRDANGRIVRGKQSSRQAPFQKFRWVHFPRYAGLPGEFTYRITPVFMNDKDELSYGEFQEAAIRLSRETYPGVLNIAFTRGYVASQSFVERYESDGPISTLLPAKADDGLTFVPTHPDTKDAKEWMGFEARSAILEVLDEAIADPQSKVCVVAFELNEPDIVSRLQQLGPRLRIIVDDSADHGAGSAETEAANRLIVSAGAGNVKRQHMGQLQHNKTIVVDGPNLKRVVCGSTNFSWRGLYVQSNNALVLKKKSAVVPFLAAFEAYWSQTPADFGHSSAAVWNDLGLSDIDARVSFSPHDASNALLKSVAADIEKTKSSLFFSLAFLYKTPGLVLDAIDKVALDPKHFVYGISDKRVGGLKVLEPNGNILTVSPAALGKDAPEPFSSEPAGGSGIRMHHKFVVIDFDKPTARVYLGSYNFSTTADRDNGENLLLIRNRRIAVSYAIEALRMIDQYAFRQEEKQKGLALWKPPRKPGEVPWWDEYYSVPRKIRERQLFA